MTSVRLAIHPISIRSHLPLRLFALALLLLMLGACGGANSMMLESYLADNQAALAIPASDDTTQVSFEVAPGTPAVTIGANLKAAGIIDDDRLFEAYVRVNDLATRLDAGVFSLSPSMTLIEIVDALQNSRSAGRLITVREGWRLEQTADWLAATDQFSDTIDGVSVQAEAYRAAGLAGPVASAAISDSTSLSTTATTDTAENETAEIHIVRFPFLAAIPQGMSLEGYLFPDTYELPAENPNGVDLIERQLTNFGRQVVPLYNAAIAEGQTTLTLHEVMTIASIVEREAVIAAERPAIARVYLNRVVNEMRLEADPTVQYAMGYQPAANQWWKTPVTLDEYGGVLSPYNTYLNTGLPPGPIASPGLSSIEAVLHPDEHNYLYFVALPDGTGAHVFAETFAEHQVNVNRYLYGN